jgi:hypothetical protein
LSHEREEERGLPPDEERARIWREVVPRGLRALSEGRVTVWTIEVADRLRRQFLGEDEGHAMSEEERQRETPESELAEAWAEAQAIAKADTAAGSWDRINAAVERARLERRLANVRAGRFLFWPVVKKMWRELRGPRRKQGGNS